MIRQATKYDKTEIIDLMKCFRAESPVEEIYGENDETHWNLLLDNLFAGAGAVFIEERKGLLMCMVLPTIWSSKVYGLHELAWYVKPEFRNGMTGYKLLKAYIEFGNSLKQQNRIKFFTLSKLPQTPSMNYEKLGFAKLDENWIQ